MAQLLTKSFRLLSRRSYAAAAVGAESKRSVEAVASVMRKAAATEQNDKEDIQTSTTFWMRDPKTGNWIPENHFDDIDVAELREKFLSKKQHHNYQLN